MSPEAGPHQTALRLWSLGGPQMCGDLDKHKNEKKEPNESTQNVKAINRELEKNSNEVYQQKIKFKKKIVLHLSVKFCLTL